MSGSIVLVGFGEALSAPEVVWSLADAGHHVLAFARRGRRSALRHSRYVEVFDITPPEQDLERARQDLAALISARLSTTEVTSVVLPLDDASLWLCAGLALPDNCALAGPKDHVARFALDKRLQIAAAAEAGFNVPPTAIVSTRHELERSAPTYPVILRPADAIVVEDRRLRKGSNWICANSEELRRATAQWDERCALLVQPYFTGVGEGIFGLATPNGVLAWSSHRRVRMMNPHGSGSSACLSQPVPDELATKAERLVRIADWTGLFMVELLHDRDGIYWFTEFNGRAWGSMALARRQNLEYPAWAVAMALGGEVPAPVSPPARQPMLCRHLGRELVHLLFLMRGPRSHAIADWPSLGATLRHWASPGVATSYYNFRGDDWRVFATDLLYVLRDNLVKAR